MASNATRELLAKLAATSEKSDGSDLWSMVEATDPELETADAPESIGNDAEEGESQIDELIERISALTNAAHTGKIGDESPVTLKTPTVPNAYGGGAPPQPIEETQEERDGTAEWFPPEPRTLREAGLSETEVEALALKFLLGCGDASGHEIAQQLRLPFPPIEKLLHRLKSERMVSHRGASSLNDYIYQLTSPGFDRARQYSSLCSYFGSAPVTLNDYIESVKRQSLTKQNPQAEDLKRAFADLLINQQMLNRLGPAIASGRGLFLYGAPGNGKTSIAERVTESFGSCVWIPRSIVVHGEIFRLYDPGCHVDAPLPNDHGLVQDHKVDQRWIRIKRPTVVVGGELTMENLEIRIHTGSGIGEAPVQMKSNCGTLVIDDFGRQRISTTELLNRWIVPLEKRYDFLNLPNGKTIQVPFDQLIIFSTNLEPKDLVDEAFLRRIPYKVEVGDPTESEFRELMKLSAKNLGIKYNDEVVSYLINTHYTPCQREFRCCQPRDLLLQVRNFCKFHGAGAEMSTEMIDFAVENYFSVM